MDPIIGGSLIMGSSALLGGAINNRAIRRANQDNMRMQEEFAKNGIRWRVDDAKAAGIHPLYALGASSMSPSTSVMAETGIGNGLQQMGQDVGRAMRQGMETTELQDSIMQEQLKNWQLKNELLGIDVKRASTPNIPLNYSGVGSDFMQGSQGAGFQLKPVQVEQSSPFDKGRSLGAAPDVGFAYTSDGGLVVVPSKDIKERIEDQIVPEAMWAWRNNVLPAFSGITKPDIREFPLPLGYSWEWNWKKQGFYPQRLSGPAGGQSLPVHSTMPEKGEYRRY